MASTLNARIILREVGTALAVLALWMLLLLAPLHQTSGLLRELAKTGYDISGAWSICVSIAQDEDGKAAAIPICPAQGIGKTDLATPPPPLRLAELLPVMQDMVFSDDLQHVHRPQNFTPGQPRGPPTLV